MLVSFLLFLSLSVPSYAQSHREVTLTSDTTAEYFEPLTPWMPSMNTGTGVQAYVFLTEKIGNMRVRVGVQTANTTQFPGTPVFITSQATYVSAAGPTNGNLYRFNPNDTNDGDIDTRAWYRIGLLYSLNATGSGSATVRIEGLAHE